MKNRIITALLITAMLSGLTACGGKEPSASDLTTNRKRVADMEDAAAADGDETGEEAEEVQEPEEAAKTVDGVVFGSDEAKGYDGFEYLMEELVSTSNTKSGDKKTVSVFVPDGDYPSVSGSYATSERMGVVVDVDIDPYLQYNAADYTAGENLEAYVEDEMSYSSYLYGVDIGEVEEIGEDAAMCVVTYMQFDSYDSSYSPYYQVFCLKELGDNVMGLVDICIIADETTGRTKDMIAELSSFYQVDIGWDNSFAEAKRTEFENSDEYNADAFNLGYMTFELPEGWEKDEDESSYSEAVFAPNGDAIGEYGYISIEEDYADDEGVIDEMLSDLEYTQSYFEEVLGEDVTDLVIDDAGETFLGRTLMMEMKADGDTGIFYIAQNGYSQYAVYAVVWAEEGEEAEENVRAALDMLFETGQLKE
ncbi:MAG: hypothetical protein NC341_06390 [Blautia sp.]|nr:hypothetical protein [Blautia sp.]MCM1201006.1 hypothetical protein [Bacteroides fragilis]